MNASARSAAQRKQDTLERLERDVDAWIATASDGRGTPYLVPLSFWWDGRALVIATPTASTTSRNLQATGRVRVGVGPTRDVVLIEGTVEVLEAGELTPEFGDAFAAKSGFDPRGSRVLQLLPHPAATGAGVAGGQRARRADSWRPSGSSDETADAAGARRSVALDQGVPACGRHSCSRRSRFSSACGTTDGSA